MIVCLFREHERMDVNPLSHRHLQGLGTASTDDFRTARHNGALAETGENNRCDENGERDIASTHLLITQ